MHWPRVASLWKWQWKPVCHSPLELHGAHISLSHCTCNHPSHWTLPPSTAQHPVLTCSVTHSYIPAKLTQYSHPKFSTVTPEKYWQRLSSCLKTAAYHIDQHCSYGLLVPFPAVEYMPLTFIYKYCIIWYRCNTSKYNTATLIKIFYSKPFDVHLYLLLYLVQHFWFAS